MFAGKKMTAFVCGVNDTHNRHASTATASVATGRHMLAAAAAIQTASPTLVPAIGIGQRRTAWRSGAPAIASVPNPAGMVDLFNSASSLAGGALANASDAALFEAYYKANLSLHAAAARPTMTLGPADRQGGGEPPRQEPGVAAASPTRGRSGALRHHQRHAGQAVVDRQHAHHDGQGVRAQPDVAPCMLPAFLDDPHGAFQDMATLASTVRWRTARSSTPSWPTCMAIDDPMCAGRKVGDNLVMAWMRRHDQGSVHCVRLARRHAEQLATSCGSCRTATTRRAGSARTPAGTSRRGTRPPARTCARRHDLGAAGEPGRRPRCCSPSPRATMRRVSDFYRGVDIRRHRQREHHRLVGSVT